MALSSDLAPLKMLANEVHLCFYKEFLRLYAEEGHKFSTGNRNLVIYFRRKEQGVKEKINTKE